MIVSSLDRSIDTVSHEALAQRLPVERSAEAALPRSADAVRKVLFANKFLFRNGGSEAVMFDEMDWLGRHDLAIVDF